MDTNTISAALDTITTAVSSIRAALGTTTTTTTSIIAVKAGENLQTYIDHAPPGATLSIAPGVYDGITLRTGVKNLTIQTAVTLPPSRVGPMNLGDLVQLKPTAAGRCIATEAGAVGYTLIGIACLPGDPTVAMVELGDDNATDPAAQPDQIVFDRCLLVANSATGGRRGIAANTRSLMVKGCYIAGFWATADAQAICGWNGPGPFTILDSYLESSGENVMFGGADARSEALMPAHLVLRGCYLSKPLAWQGASGHTVKDVFELKAMRSALVEANIMENSWVSGQTGFLIQLTPRNQSGTAPWSNVTDVTIRHNVLRHAAGAVNLLGTDNLHSSGVMTGVTITDNLIYDINPAQFGTNGRLFQIVAGPQQVIISNNTCVGAGLNSFLSLSGTPAAQLQVTGNVFPEGSYGIAGSGATPGTPGWAAFTTSDSVFTGNLIAKGTSGRTINYPGTGNVVSLPGEVVTDPTNFQVIAKYANPAAGPGCDLTALPVF